MRVFPLAISDVIVFEPSVFEDERGIFFESFNQKVFEEAVGRAVRFVQDNQSVSHKNVLRGLHYQAPPHGQGKLVRVVRGAAFDVAVDIRPGSPTFGRWVAETLTGVNRRQIWIPEGFAHGFIALEDDTELHYKVTDFYEASSERTLLWSDPNIGIEWPIQVAPILSSKDASATGLLDTAP